MIEVLRSYMRARNFVIHDFVIMPDHLHLLLTVPAETGLEKALQLIKGGFSRRATIELGFRGEIWQRGFSDVRITNDQSFRIHQEYILRNPVKAGLANAEHEYRFGSAYLKKLKQQRAASS